jgi:hypothetical protein
MCSVNVQFVCIQCISLKNSLLLIAKTQCDFSEEYFLITYNENNLKIFAHLNVPCDQQLLR